MTPPPDDIAAKEGLPFAAAPAAGPEPAVRVPDVGRIAYRELAIAAAIAVALVIPWVVTSFVMFQLTQVMIYALAILGLNLLTGFNGQFSLGHSAFYGIGAYTAAILMHNYGVGYIWTVPAAGAVCFVVGFLFGLPALRLQNLYLALATFTLATVMPQILKFHGLEEWTGGVQGLVIDQPDAPSFLPIDSDQWLYYFTLVIVLIMFAAAANLIHSRSGRAIMAIRDHPIAAAAMGINNSLYKTLTFGVSALYTGVAGALGALAIAFVAPDSFTIFLSIALLVGLVIGGVGSIPGCLLGGLFVLYVPNIAESVSTGLAGAIYGVILLLVIFVMPAGAAGFARVALARVSRMRQ
jgi:branched-chain amino acid transport system permease protein